MSKGKKKKVFLGSVILLLLGIGALVFFWGFISSSSLKWITRPELKGQMREICGEPHQLYPPTSLDWPFPAFSPDGRYYVGVGDARLRRAKELKIFWADTSQLIGKYSYFSLIVYCWAEDSTGIYVSDRDPGDSSLFIPFSRGGRIGPVKKLFVP